MNRIAQTFAQLAASGRKALIPFVTAGDPALEATVPVMHALVEAGADVIELGMPFSDPMADGPTIQRSSERALTRGASLNYILQCVRTFRESDAVTPVVLMGYLNPVEIRGLQRFAEEAVQAGVDGVLFVDLPPEEAEETRAIFSAAELALVALAAPTTSDDRMEILCNTAQGYLYYVSYAGVTGADRLDTQAAGQRIHWIVERSRIPVVVGFGIKDAVGAAAMAADADGVVVGSALVQVLAEAQHPGEAAERGREFLRPLREAMDQSV